MGADTCAVPADVQVKELQLDAAGVANARISLTERAARHVQTFLAKRGKGLGIRVGVRTSGCSGLAYRLEYVDSEDPQDIRFDCHGVAVYVDPKSLAYLNGTELDYVREGLNEGFKFNNPNVKSQCGCGESFNV
ncbi:MAG: iron-sulfur cluster assembly protein IscA [Thiobacillaceae bacterium]|nr:iron-sulfur cluster assembly protein IscA [Thiobacillaceae bacterium]